MDPELDTSLPEIVEKKSRKRLKKLCAQIRQQMEFYFSDANLTKDRFLRQMIDQTEDGYLPLELFCKFNRIRTLTVDCSLIAKALSSSKLLEVSSDKTKIKRNKPIANVEDVDERTIYVECLPSGIDHDWVKQVFEPCGQVVYISLPKYKSTGDPKGFAFVEFSSKEEAQKACQSLNNPPPDAPDRPGRFPKTSKQLKQLQKQISSKQTTEENSGENFHKAGGKRNKRRRRNTSESSGEGQDEIQLMSKRAKEYRCESEQSGVTVYPGTDKENKIGSSSSVSDVESTDNIDGNIAQNGDLLKCKRKLEVTDKSEEEKSKKAKLSKESDRILKVQEKDAKESEQELKSEEVDENERNLKRKRKSEPEEVTVPKKVRINEKVEVEEVATGGKRNRRRKKKEKLKDKTLPQLRVIPKQEWLQLRQEYLNLQKSSMKKLKKSLKHSQVHNNKDKSKEKNVKTMHFQPGLIVKVTSSKPTNRLEVKAVANSVAEVAYIDYKDFDLEGYIRCHSGESAIKITALRNDQYTFSLLQGDDEKVYWDKILEDREKKLSTKTKTKKRGAQKIIERAEKASAEAAQKKHVFFDD